MELKKAIFTIFLLLIFAVSNGQDKNTSAFSAESQVFENNVLDLTNLIEVYPNPTVDHIMVNIKNSKLVKTEFEIHSVIGNSVDLLVEQVTKSKYRIDVREYSSGYYFLVVKDDQTQFKRAYKFLKE